MKDPNFTESLEEMDAGLVIARLSKALAEAAMGTVEHNKQGKVVLTLTMKRIGETSQVNVEHKIDFQRPTARGTKKEDFTTATPMYVNKHGYLSVAPEMQTDIFKHAENM